MSELIVDDQFLADVLKHRWTHNGVGYLSTKVNGRTVTLHRYVWGLAHGGQVPAMLDHINGNKNDCRIVNLRPATGSLNCRSRVRSNGGRLPEGVQPKPGRLPFFTHICLWRATLYLGSFSDLEAASAAYEKARRIILAIEAQRAVKWIGQPIAPPARTALKKAWNDGWRAILLSDDFDAAVQDGVAFADSFVCTQTEAVA
jgi:hypothetical protein